MSRTKDLFLKLRRQPRARLDHTFRALVVERDGAILDERFARARPAAAQTVRTGLSTFRGLSSAMILIPYQPKQKIARLTVV